MNDSIPLKQCSKCHKEYPETQEYFYLHKLGKHGFAPSCRSCCKKYSEERNRKNGHPPLNRPLVANGQKRCNKCLNWYPNTIEYFSGNKKNKRDGLRPECKNCVNAQTKLRKRKGASIKAPRIVVPKNVRAKRYRDANSEKIKARKQKYQRLHPDKANIITQRYRARKRSLPSTFTVVDWIRALEFFNNRCAVCQRPQGLWHKLAQDHWIPVARGGGYTPDNIVPLCDGMGGCNESKHDLPATDWLIKRFGKREADTILRRVDEYFQWIAQK
jgi:hypothetical protein